MGPPLSGSKESCRAYLDAHSTSGIEIKGVFWLDSFLSARRRWVAVPTLTNVINLINNNMIEVWQIFVLPRNFTRSRSSLILNLNHTATHQQVSIESIVISLFRYTFSIQVQNTLLQQCRVYHQPPSIFFYTTHSNTRFKTPGGYLFLCFLSPPLPFPFPPRFLFL